MEESTHVCPPIIGKLMVSPLRKIMHNPKEILSGLIKSSNNILEVGPGMGFFSLPMAEMTGSTGMVFCVDIQEAMLKKLDKRAEIKSLNNQISTIKCSTDSLKVGFLKNQIDFCLLFAVIHEIPDQKRVFEEIYNSLRYDSKVLFAEPKGHVPKPDFEKSIELAQEVGFKISKEVEIKGCLAILLEK